jgi:hypothetical protein
VKVTSGSTWSRAVVGSALTVALSATFAFAAPHDAGAATRAKTISRDTVIERSQSWVKKRVPYSQRRYYKGYRQDCSGFVSMAWKLGKSYTSRTLPAVSKRVPVSKAMPGDAVHTPGHVAIFAGWKNKKARTFYAYEQRTWGKVATKSVRYMRPGSKVLRRPGIKNTTVAAKKPASSTTSTSSTSTSSSSTTASVTSVVTRAPGAGTTSAVAATIRAIEPDDS